MSTVSRGIVVADSQDALWVYDPEVSKTPSQASTFKLGLLQPPFAE